jgi:hypothetical protein
LVPVGLFEHPRPEKRGEKEKFLSKARSKQTYAVVRELKGILDLRGILRIFRGDEKGRIGTEIAQF